MSPHSSEFTGVEYPIDIMNPKCPSRLTLEVLADKWTMLIVIGLSNGKKRNGELKRGIGDISQKMLTQTLRKLESGGLVKRTEYPQIPPKVEYELTELGRTLLVPMRALADWAENYYLDVYTAMNQEQDTP